MDRSAHLGKAAEILRLRRDELAALITQEMGKLIAESRAEVEKCALGCDFYAKNAAQFLQAELIETDARQSYVAYQPLGTVLAIMPWNFPLWQVMRFAIPALAAGNCVLLKHAANVPQCALAIESVFCEAGLPQGVFQTRMINAAQIQALIADRRIHAVTLTGSTAAGREVAATAGKHLKKTVLELGGSDPFVVLEDADLNSAVATAIQSRYTNCGQSCIAAKRFIVVDAIADDFIEAFVAAAKGLNTGDPMDEHTRLAPMAREDLRTQLHNQVKASMAQGAQLLAGGKKIAGDGWFYPATVLDAIPPDTPAWRDELFGPVAAIFRVKDESEALEVANDTAYGLGGSVWTGDIERGERFALQLQCGSTFVNGLVKSDPRLPFGGIKASGYGRELSLLGIREFLNAKTVWIGD